MDLLDKVLNEAYFGNIPEIDKMVGCIHRYRARKARALKDIDMGKDLYDTSKDFMDKDIVEFNRLVEKVWGFGAFSLSIVGDITTNAFTISCSNRYDISTKKMTIADSKYGLRYDKKYNVTGLIWIHSGLILNEEFTDREIMAVLLHEIGHNFSAAVDGAANLATNMGKVLNIFTVYGMYLAILINPIDNYKLTTAYSNADAISYVEEKKTLLNNTKAVSSIVKNFRFFSNIIENIANSAGSLILPLIVLTNYSGYLLTTLYNKIMSLFTDPSSIIHVLKKHDEKVADNFATMYGFGSDLSSALAKMHNLGGNLYSSKVLEKTPLLSLFYAAIMSPFALIDNLFDPHPSNKKRRRSQITYLVAELKKQNIEPKAKKQIIEQLTELVALEENLNSTLDKINKEEYAEARADVNEIILNIDNYSEDKFNEKMDEAIAKRINKK